MSKGSTIRKGDDAGQYRDNHNAIFGDGEVQEEQHKLDEVIHLKNIISRCYKEIDDLQANVRELMDKNAEMRNIIR